MSFHVLFLTSLFTSKTVKVQNLLPWITPTFEGQPSFAVNPNLELFKTFVSLAPHWVGATPDNQSKGTRLYGQRFSLMFSKLFCRPGGWTQGQKRRHWIFLSHCLHAGWLWAMHQKQQGSRLEAPENKNKDRDRDARDVKSEGTLLLKQQMHQKRPGQSCLKKRVLKCRSVRLPWGKCIKSKRL